MINQGKGDAQTLPRPQAQQRATMVDTTIIEPFMVDTTISESPAKSDYWVNSSGRHLMLLVENTSISLLITLLSKTEVCLSM